MFSLHLMSSCFKFKNVKIKVYTNFICPPPHGRWTLLIILIEEYKLRVFENIVMRGIFGSMRNAVTGEWEKNTQGKDSQFTLFFSNYDDECYSASFTTITTILLLLLLLPLPPLQLPPPSP